VAVADPKEKSSFAPKEGSQLYALAYTPDGKQIAAGGNSTVAWLMDAASGREVRRFTSNPTAISHLLISPDAKHLFTACRKEIHQFDLGTGKELRYLEEHQTSISGLALCFLRMWDASRGRLLHAVKHEFPVSGLASSPDGKKALTGGWDANARAWDLTADPPAETSKVLGGNGHLYYFTFAPDGKTYATFGSGQKLILWETATHKKLKEWPFEEPVSALAFASDGRHLAVALNTGPVYVLRLGKPEDPKTGAK
jgi:WD40 repeat protein